MAEDATVQPGGVSSEAAVKEQVNKLLAMEEAVLDSELDVLRAQLAVGLAAIVALSLALRPYPSYPRLPRSSLLAT